MEEVNAGAEISPEQQLRNVAVHLLRLTTPMRHYNGRRRAESYAASKAEIAQAGRHLADLVQAYLNGEIAAIRDDGVPF